MIILLLCIATVVFLATTIRRHSSSALLMNHKLNEAIARLGSLEGSRLMGDIAPTGKVPQDSVNYRV